MNEAMVRFNLVGGLVYTLTGDEAVKAFWAYVESTSDVFIIRHDGKTVEINNNYIVSVEWKGVE